MCDPTIYLALAVAGTAQQTSAQNKALKYNAQINENNAKLLESQKRDSRIRGQESAGIRAIEGAGLLGTQRQALASSGVVTDEGTAGLIQQQTRRTTDIDQLTIKSNAERQVYGIEGRRLNELQSARSLKSQRRDPFLTSLTTALYATNSNANLRKTFYGNNTNK